jgi:hypothetical protein
VKNQVQSYVLILLSRLPCGYCLAMLFQPPQEELSGGKVAAVLRHANVSLAGVCAEHLVDGLRADGGAAGAVAA